MVITLCSTKVVCPGILLITCGNPPTSDVAVPTGLLIVELILYHLSNHECPLFPPCGCAVPAKQAGKRNIGGDMIMKNVCYGLRVCAKDMGC